MTEYAVAVVSSECLVAEESSVPYAEKILERDSTGDTLPAWVGCGCGGLCALFPTAPLPTGFLLITTGGLFILVSPGSGGSGDSDSLAAAMVDDVFFAAVSLGGGGGREDTRESLFTDNTRTAWVFLTDDGGGSGRSFV